MDPLDAIFRSAHEREAHARGTASAILAKLEAVEDVIAGKLARRIAAASRADRSNYVMRRTRRPTARLAALLETVRELAARWRAITEAEIRAAAREVAIAEAELQDDVLDGDDRADLSDSAVAGAVFDEPLMAKPVDEYFSDQERSVLNTLTDAIRTGFVEAASPDAVVASIVGAAGVVGLIDRHRGGVRMIAPTVLSHAANTATMQVYEARGVEAVRYLSVMDSRTSTICKGLSGTVWAIDDPGILRPPRHPRCRSQLIADTIARGGTQASKMASGPGQVDGLLDYETLLKRQPVAWQREQFTALQWKLFRKGDVSLRGMVDTMGTRGLTDSELRLRYARILRELGESRRGARAA